MENIVAAPALILLYLSKKQSGWRSVSQTYVPRNRICDSDGVGSSNSGAP
jgi:hypothetical protein